MSEKTLNSCPYCKGQGYTISEEIPCQHCGGTGFENYEPEPDFDYPEDNLCFQCEEGIAPAEMVKRNEQWGWFCQICGYFNSMWSEA